MLTAIGKARSWLNELTTGRNFADIAGREGICERRVSQLILLAFVPPRAVRDLIESPTMTTTVRKLAKTVPLVWQEITTYSQGAI